MIRKLFAGLCIATGFAFVVVARVVMAREPLEDQPDDELTPEVQRELDELRRTALELWLSQQPRVVYRAPGDHPERNVWAGPRGWQ